MSRTTPPTDILKSLKNDTLGFLYESDNPEEKAKNVSKKNMVTSISAQIEEAGVKYILEIFTRDLLRNLIEGIKVNWKNDNQGSKRVIQKKLSTLMNEQGIDDFLDDHCNVDLLNEIIDELGLDDVNSKKKEHLVRAIGGHVRELGMNLYLGSFTTDCLNDICEDLRLKTYGSSNKRKLVEAIVYQEDLERPAKKKRRVVTASKKKKQIKRGITFDDIFQHYNVSEVRDYCRDNGIRSAGKKGVIIKRVLAYLDGDESVLVDTEKSGRGRKPKSAGKGKSKRGRS